MYYLWQQLFEFYESEKTENSHITSEDVRGFLFASTMHPPKPTTCCNIPIVSEVAEQSTTTNPVKPRMKILRIEGLWEAIYVLNNRWDFIHK